MLSAKTFLQNDNLHRLGLLLHPNLHSAQKHYSILMEFIKFPVQSIANTMKLTEEELYADCIEVEDGQYYLIDENHSGFLFLTDECCERYNISCGDGPDCEAEPIDWEIWCEPDELAEYRDKGYKWNFDILQCAGVYDAEGNQIREGYEDEDVCKMNGILQEMLEHPGCIVMGWCDG